MQKLFSRRMAMCSCLSGLAAAGLILQSSRPVYAETSTRIEPPPSDSNYLDDVVDALRAHVRYARQEIHGNMSSDELAIERQINYRFVRTDENNAYASVDQSQARQIVFFVGMMRAIEQIAVARALVQMPELAGQAQNYIKYVGREIQRRMADPLGTADDPPIKMAWNYVDVTDPNEAAAYWNKYPEVRAGFDFECACSIALVTGHEIGHHLEGHVFSKSHSSAEQRDREWQADNQAIRLLTGTHVPALFGMPVLISFIIWDPEAQHHEFAIDHPDAKKRALNVVEKSGASLLDDESFVATLKANGNYEKFKEGIEDSKNMLENAIAQ